MLPKNFTGEFYSVKLVHKDLYFKNYTLSREYYSNFITPFVLIK